MTKSEDISVLLPVKNGSKYIFEAVNSILNQSYKNFELIIINDGSSDNTINIINSFKDKRIKIFNTTGIGLVSALNLGLSHAVGEYIARMDADDISLPNRFEAQLKILKENKNIGIVCSDIEVIDEDGNKIGLQTDVIKNNFHLYNGLTFRKKMKPIIHPSVMMRKSLLDLVGGYREYYLAEDKDLWLRLLPHTIFYRENTVLLKYRMTFEGISRAHFIEHQANSMLAVLNYEVQNKLGIDLFIEEKNELNHFHKTFLNHIKKNVEAYNAIKKYKNNTSKKLLYLKIVGFLKIASNFNAIKYQIFHRIKNRRAIDDAIRLITEFQKVKSTINLKR